MYCAKDHKVAVTACLKAREDMMCHRSKKIPEIQVPEQAWFYAFKTATVEVAYINRRNDLLELAVRSARIELQTTLAEHHAWNVECPLKRRKLDADVASKTYALSSARTQQINYSQILKVATEEIKVLEALMSQQPRGVGLCDEVVSGTQIFGAMDAVIRQIAINQDWNGLEMFKLVNKACNTAARRTMIFIRGETLALRPCCDNKKISAKFCMKNTWTDFDFEGAPNLSVAMLKIDRTQESADIIISHGKGAEYTPLFHHVAGQVMAVRRVFNRVRSSLCVRIRPRHLRIVCNICLPDGQHPCVSPCPFKSCYVNILKGALPELIFKPLSSSHGTERLCIRVSPFLDHIKIAAVY
jgi:hypothetical protein